MSSAIRTVATVGRHADPANVNREAWAHPEQLDAFARVSGWNDPSERGIISGLPSAGGLGDVCDIGVGGGRTVPLLVATASSYVAIDFMPEMVQVAKDRLPGVDIRLGDARHLEFPDASFDLVVFSSNGLDALGHDDRMVALTEIRRILRTRGVLVFSSHNYLGPGPRERPWGLPPIHLRQPRSSARAVGRRLLRQRRMRERYRAAEALHVEGPGWSMAASGAADFGLVIHYATIDELLRELRQVGFGGSIDVWDDAKGVRLEPTGEHRRVWYFNVVAAISG